MDGVLVDFDLSLERAFPPIKHMAWETPARIETVDYILERNKNLFAQCEPMPFAVKAFNILCRHYNVYILSTPMWTLPESYADKRIWVEQHLGTNAKKKLILSHNKALMMGEYLIDDRLANGSENFKGEHIHFGQEGFRDWRSVLQYLAKKDNWTYE